MTLDEAIVHERQVEQDIYVEALLSHANPDGGKLFEHIKRGVYHDQIASWLEDLKRRIEYDGELMGSGALNNAYQSGYEKAIDDFVAKLKDSLANNYKHFISTDSDGFAWLTTDAVETHIDNVADQLNAGTSND